MPSVVARPAARIVAPAPVRRPHRAGRIVALAGLAVALVAACGSDTKTGGDRLAGQLLLIADATGAASLDVGARTGDAVASRPVDLPGPATTWVAAGRPGVLVATLADGTLHLSDPVEPGKPGPAWRAVKATDPAGDAPAGPFWFPTWDPEGNRFAALSGDLRTGTGVAVVLIDPSTSGVLRIPLARTVLPAPPAWLDGDRLALVGGTPAEPTSIIVDTTTGDLTDGPAGARFIATSADGSTIATLAATLDRVAIADTAAWLGGDRTAIGGVSAGSDDRTLTSFALDRDGSRLGLAWAERDGTFRVDVHQRDDDWRRIASQTIDDGARGAVVGWLR